MPHPTVSLLYFLSACWPLNLRKDLEQARKLVVEVSGSSRPWAAVRKAELNILRRPLGEPPVPPRDEEWIGLLYLKQVATSV